MASLGMQGPYTFDSSTVDSNITRTSAGNYALGHKNSEGIFIVKYIGRSDTDVNARIKDHLREGHKLFKYSYATSPKAAFEKECQNYHDFGGSEFLDNKIHPDEPSNSKEWKCPVCGE